MKNIDNWSTILPCTQRGIKKVMDEIGIACDVGYEEFLLWSDGGEGYIGYNYLSLWSLKNLIQLNKDYDIKKYLGDNYFVFGTDGGSNCYGFDLSNEGAIFTSPIGDLDEEEIIIVAKKFDEFINKARHEKLNQ